MNKEELVQKIKIIIAEKVTGVWVEAHDAYGHKYRNTKTGHIQRSVTTKLGGVLVKEHLINWAVRMGIEWLLKDRERINKLINEEFRDDTIKGAQLAHTDIRDDSGHVGTDAHNCLERYINEWIDRGERPENMLSFMIERADPRSIAAVRGAEQWFKKHVIIPIASEMLVGNIKYSAGTLDLLAIVDGKLTLIDHKTSNAIDKEGYSLQVSAYKFFFEEMTGIKIKDCKILHLSKDNDAFSIHKVVNPKADYSEFKKVCSIYDWKKNKKEKIIRDIKRVSI